MLGIIENFSDMEAQTVAQRNLTIQLVALILFLLIGGFFSILIYAEDGGDTSSRFKRLVIISAFCRLAWLIYKRAFRFRDYFFYLVAVIGFCLLIDFELGYILSAR